MFYKAEKHICQNKMKRHTRKQNLRVNHRKASRWAKRTCHEKGHPNQIATHTRCHGSCAIFTFNCGGYAHKTLIVLELPLYIDIQQLIVHAYDKKLHVNHMSRIAGFVIF